MEPVSENKVLPLQDTAGGGETPHEHRFTFLRQEHETSKQWGDRVRERKVVDVYFCEGCLEYRRKHVATEEPDPRSFGWFITWRAPE